jgi:hypothetical protein
MADVAYATKEAHMINSSSTISNVNHTRHTRPQKDGPPGGPGRREKPSHTEAVNNLGASLSEEVRNDMLSEIDAMSKDGATNEEIKSYVHETLESHGVDIPVRGQHKPGSLINTSA